MQCVSNMLKIYPNEEYKMHNSSPDTDPTGSSVLYNDSGYFTNHNPDPQSFSSNSNSDPSFEVVEEISLHSKPGECLQTLASTSGVYFCEDAVFDEPKLEGPPLCDNTNNYEQFSSLIKFSLEETSGSYLTNTRDSSVLQYFDQDSLSSYSSINPSQPICVSEGENRQNIISQAVEQCLTSQNNTPTKSFPNPMNPNLSPELFSEDEPEPETSITNISQTQKPVLPNEQFLKNDRKLLKRIQETLSGVPPPPSVTILQLTVGEMLEKINSNKHLFLSVNKDDTASKSVDKCLNESVEGKEKSVKSLLVTSSQEDVDKCDWPEIMNCRFHGLYYNRSRVSEDIEQHCSRYLTRYVGAETASSCTAWAAAPSSATKRRTARLRWAARSPGRRLSHLARRRITFSSASLQQAQAGAKLSVLGNSSSGSRQLMIDPRRNVSFNKRRSPRKSPWKKSPRKSPQKRIKTPNSSAKKRSARRLNMGVEDDPKPGGSKISSTKRALFQSPENSNRSTVSSADSTQAQRTRSKRSLFTSPTATSNCDKKRKRGEDLESHPPSKFPRSLSFDVQHSHPLREASTGGVAMQRRNSEVIQRPSSGRGELSNLHKQKMLWAVSEALRAQQINMSHPQFRGFASILCKVIKHLVPDLMSNGPRQPGSTSDRMLRIARQHSYAVTRGKTFDEIMQQVRDAAANYKNLKPPSGYVPLEAANSAKKVLQDKVMNIDNRKIDSGSEEINKLKSIRRQIVFDDNEISRSCYTNR